MASETLGDTKAEDEEVREEKEQNEAEEKEGEDFPEKTVSRENEQNEGVEEKDGLKNNDEINEEKGGIRKGKRSRKQGSRRGQAEAKKSGQESEAKKGKSSSPKEPVTPNERPTRERKTVERYSEPLPGRATVSKGLSIEKGSGTQLKDIPNVAFKLSKKKPDDNLQILHTILFGKKAKIHTLKRNIGQFSGYVWVENEGEKQKAKVKEKIDKCIKEKLVDFCDVLNIPINKAVVRKEELSAKLLEFLESPHATTDVLLADKEQKGKSRKRKATPSKNTSPGEPSTETQAKKRKRTSVGEKAKHSSQVAEENEVEHSVSGDDSDEHEDNDTAMKEQNDQEEINSGEEEEDQKEQKKTKKRSSRKNVKEDSGAIHKDKIGTASRSVKNPAKSTKRSSSISQKPDGDDVSVIPKSKATKKKDEKGSKKDESDPTKRKTTSKKQSSKTSAEVSSKDLGKGKTSKKAKPEPSTEEMHAVVADILKQVDFNTATLSDILRQLGTHFGLDLMHRKAEVKAIITDVISNMSDEEDEEEAEENEEAGNDAGKDGDGDVDGDE